MVIYDEDRPVPNLLIAPTANAGPIDAFVGSARELMKTVEELAVGLPVLEQGELPDACRASDRRPTSEPLDPPATSGPNGVSSVVRMGLPRRRLATNGVELDVIDAGTPGDPVVVLVHGFPESSHSWRHQVDPLVAAGYRVLVPDQRGYGASSAPLDVGDIDPIIWPPTWSDCSTMSAPTMRSSSATTGDRWSCGISRGCIPTESAGSST